MHTSDQKFHSLVCAIEMGIHALQYIQYNVQSSTICNSPKLNSRTDPFWYMQQNKAFDFLISLSVPQSLESFTRFSLNLCIDLIVLYWLLSSETSISSPGIKSITLYTRFGSHLDVKDRGTAGLKGRRIWGGRGSGGGILLTALLYLMGNTELLP